MGLTKLVQGLATMLSIPLAGYVTEEWGWRWLFVAAVIANAILTIFMWFLIPSNAEKRSPNSIKNFDLLGSGMLMAFMIAALMSIQFFIKGYDLRLSLLLAGLTCVTLIAFVRAERRAEEPVIHFSLFRIPGLSISAAQALFLGFVDGALLMLLPFLFIKGYGWSAAYAGSILFLLHVGRPPAAALAGWVSDRYGSARIITIGAIVSLAAQAGMWFFSYPLSMEMVSVCLLLLGLSQSIMVVANLGQIFNVLPTEHVEMAPALNLVLMQVGIAAGQALSAALGMANPYWSTGLTNRVGISEAPVVILLVAVIFAAGMSAAYVLPRFLRAELSTLTERRAT
ncbi:MAG: MFS transporter [Gammaproteobacteria bacterium]